MNFLHIRNAECRALWTLRYLTQACCADPWEGTGRYLYDRDFVPKLAEAREWLRKRRVIRVRGNVIYFKRAAK